MVFRKYNLTDDDVTVLTFVAKTGPQFADLNFEGNIRSECELDFNCFFEKRNSFNNIYEYTGKILLTIALQKGATKSVSAIYNPKNPFKIP